MENHPIPQDVTGFQFKLIGDMTVKQFAYLAVGIIFGWIFFSAPFHIIIRFPLALLCIGSGVSFAFLPLEGRPLDVMVMHFFRAIFASNLYVYQKIGGDLSLFSNLAVATAAIQPQQQTSNKLQQYLQSIPQKSGNKLDNKETLFFQSLSAYNTPALSTTNPTATTPSVSDPKQTVIHATPQPIVSVQKQEVVSPAPSFNVVLQKATTPTPQTQTNSTPIRIETAPPAQIEIKLQQAATSIEQQLQQAKIQEQQQKELGFGQQEHVRVEVLQNQLNQILAQKDLLEKQLLEVSKKFQQKQQPQTPLVNPLPTVQKIPKNMGVAAGFPIMPEFPNLLVGVVKDSRGNILPNILVEVKDHEGNPVRAFKTNALGQFASATPLLNGTYTLVFEDPTGKQKFEAVELTADGTIITPLGITSTDDREVLRKELFG